MFLWTTIVAILAALARVAPGLGIIAALLSVPAAVRTVIGASRRSAQSHRPLRAWEKVFIFANSLQIMLIAVLAAIVAFMAVCTATYFVTMPLTWLADWIPSAIVGVVSLAGAGYAGYAVMRSRWNEED